ncbi:MAG: Holliday junction resolvase RuvX [Gemmatimonadetes bacterium]|nr:Holliday junction resolvase RuvX [Gemmatimonadota bacterium]MYD26273.1 Holliday junction resolvase RuvX [Gemmatimonadota bacterium]MYJ00360.1 Holliday junction resolvase RuvX [Gemmatimonadota bacterium]
MPRKNRPNSATTPRRQKSKRGRQTGLPAHGADGMAGDGMTGDRMVADGMAGDLADTVAPSGTGTGQTSVGRVLAVDYGERRVGLALSDPAGLIAQGLETIQTADTVESLASIVDIVEEQKVREIILGLPVHMDGTAGEMAGKVEALADELRKKVSCDVRTWDERLTSVSARRAMHEMGSTPRGNKGSLDRIAATLLLQNYLDFRRGKATEPDSRL